MTPIEDIFGGRFAFFIRVLFLLMGPDWCAVKNISKSRNLFPKIRCGTHIEVGNVNFSDGANVHLTFDDYDFRM